MYQRNTTNNDNRRQFIQRHYFTYQRKGNHELQLQALNTLLADLQNLPSGGSGDGGGGDIGTM